MKLINKLGLFFLVIAGVLVSCEEPEINTKFSEGTGYLITGDEEVNTLDTNRYYIRAIEGMSYSWTLDGEALETTWEGQAVDVSIETPGEHTLVVTDGSSSEELIIVAESVDQIATMNTTALLDSISVEEGSVSGDTLWLPVTISNRNLAETTFGFTVTADDAVAGVDYELLANTLTIPQYETTGNIPVRIFDDADMTGERSFTVILDEIISTGAGERTVTLPEDTTNNASVPSDTTVVTIMDDMKYLTADLGGADTLKITSAGTFSIEAMLSEALMGQTMVSYTLVDDPDATDGIDVKNGAAGSFTIFDGYESEELLMSVTATDVESEDGPYYATFTITGVSGDIDGDGTFGDSELMLGSGSFSVVIQY